MTRDELQALLRVCPACNGTGWPKGWCHTCAGMGYVLPATPDVLELAGAGAALPPDPASGTISGRGDEGEYLQPEQQRCECGACWWDGVQWVTRYFEAGDYPELHSELVVPVAHCPGSCGCRLSVVDGEPCVGEKYAVLERDARRFRAVERAMGTPLDSPFSAHRWHYETDGMDTRYDTLGEYADALGGETDGE